jgi:hypothetical protein
MTSHTCQPLVGTSDVPPFAVPEALFTRGISLSPMN